MPSSNKTGHLGLNKWLGSDKPKKDDFNSDNTLVDAACKALADQLGTVQTGLSTANQNLLNHATNAASHVTSAERAAWNAPRETMTTGTYTGNGAASRKITTNLNAKFGVLYAVGMAPVQADWNGDESKVYSGFFGTKGCSKGIAQDSTGFTVTHTGVKPMDGCSYKLNESGVVYVYIAWPA